MWGWVPGGQVKLEDYLAVSTNTNTNTDTNTSSKLSRGAS